MNKWVPIGDDERVALVGPSYEVLGSELAGSSRTLSDTEGSIVVNLQKV